jgi:hypothetical protein
MNIEHRGFWLTGCVRIFAVSLFGALALGVSGCAAPASKEGMSVDTGEAIMAPAEFPLKGTVTVGAVSGGEETNPMWTSEVGNEAFRGALESSMRAGDLLAATGAAKYRLNASLLNLQQPLFGLDMRVNSKVRYELISIAGGDRLFEETIDAGYTATVGQAFLGVERLRLANEGAIRENIKKLIERLHRFPN